MEITMHGSMVFSNKSHSHIFRNFCLGLSELGHDVKVCGMKDISAMDKNNKDHQHLMDLYVDHHVYGDYNIWKGLESEFVQGGHKVDGIVHNDGSYLWSNRIREIFNKCPYTHIIRSGMDAAESIGAQMKMPVYGFFDSPVDDTIFNMNVPVSKYKTSNFVFMSVSQGMWPPSFCKRGIDIAVKAFMAEFKDSDPVELILKMGAIQPDISIMTQDRTNIKIVYGNISQPLLTKWLKTADCLLSPIRGSMWEASGLEAAAVGTPMIATDAGGPGMYVIDGATGLLVKYRWAQYDEGDRKNETCYSLDQSVNFPGEFWKEPDVKHLRRCMRFMFSNKPTCKAMGINASAHVLKNFNRRAMAKKLVQFLAGSKEYVYG